MSFRRVGGGGGLPVGQGEGGGQEGVVPGPTYLPYPQGAWQRQLGKKEQEREGVGLSEQPSFEGSKLTACLLVSGQFPQCAIAQSAFSVGL